MENSNQVTIIVTAQILMEEIADILSEGRLETDMEVINALAYQCERILDSIKQ